MRTQQKRVPGTLMWMSKITMQHWIFSLISWKELAYKSVTQYTDWLIRWEQSFPHSEYIWYYHRPSFISSITIGTVKMLIGNNFWNRYRWRLKQQKPWNPRSIQVVYSYIVQELLLHQVKVKETFQNIDKREGNLYQKCKPP